MFGIFARAITAVVASASPELVGPQMALTFWRLIMSCVALTALVGSPCVSRVTISILRPFTPPAALISSTANLTPRSKPIAGAELGPVRAASHPIRIGPLCASAGRARGAAPRSVAAEASIAPRRVINMVVSPRRIRRFPAFMTPQNLARAQGACKAIRVAPHTGRTGNLPLFLRMFPNQMAPIVRVGAGADRKLEFVMAGWGMPGPPRFGGAPVTDIRNVSSPHSRGWLGRRNRCLAPAMSFCEASRAASCPRTRFRISFQAKRRS